MASWALVTGIGAAALAFALLGFAHWASMIFWGRDLHVLQRYVIGCGIILAVLGAWCSVQADPVPAWWAWLVAVGITCGAGLGTIAGYWLDAWDGMRKERALRDGQRRAETDRYL